MIYQIRLSSQAKKFLKKLPQNISLRIINKFERLNHEPFRYLEHFEGDSCFKFKIGKYRGLIDVDKERGILFVRVFDLRGRIYK